MHFISDIFNAQNRKKIHINDVKLLFITSPKITDSTRPAHSNAGVHTLSCKLLGLCALSCRAFSYSTTQRHDSVLR